jgi:Holliday junction DNA helicase RuvB
VSLDRLLRPQSFDQYIGQSEVKKHLSIFLQAAQKRKESLEHVLLHGSAGLGKTTLAYIIAKEMGVGIRITSGPAIERAGDLAAILTNIPHGDVLFIDEIHRLNRSVEEVLYPAMEEFALDIVLGKGPGARTLRLDLPHFTLIGATTKLSSLTAPFRDRFGSTYKLQFYTVEDIEKIIQRSAKLLGVSLASGAISLIALRSRKTPRVANRLLKRVRDFAQVKNADPVTKEVAEEALTMLSIDEKGLDNVDREILKLVIEKYHGGPVGIQAIAASLGEEVATIEDVHEPYLLQEGLLARTGRGRVATEAAYRHLGKPAPQQQPSLV